MGFGLVGCGMVSQFHGKGISTSPKARLVAVCDADRARAGTFAAEYKCEVADDLDALLARDDIDVVNVLTPNATHSKIAVRCLHAHKHVIVEKPPDMTLARTDEMIVAAKKAGVKLAVCLQVRFRKAVEAIKAAVDSGRFGRLVQADTTMKWFRPKEYYSGVKWRTERSYGAGVIIQHVFHYYDVLQHLMGPVTRVWARTSNLGHPEVDLEDTAVALLDYENGAQGVVVASTACYPGTDIRIEVNGENGTAVISGERMEAWRFRDERPEDEAVRGIGREAQATGAGDAAGFAFDEHMWLIEDMCDAVSEGREPRVTAESARRTLEIALAMYKSGDTGEPVTLPLREDYLL